jgi:hypothetical protein
MPAAGFETKIPASEQPQTHALDLAATGIGPRRRWDLKEIEWDYVDRLSEGTLMNKITNLEFPRSVDNFLSSSKPISFSRITLLHAVSHV